MDQITLEQQLNAPTKEARLAAIRELTNMLREGKISRPEQGEDVNNHIHTTYSFSPYSPTKAVWAGYMAGLKTVGIMDHDSVSGAEEFHEAAQILGIAATCGMECRVSLTGTPLEGKRPNNPDQSSVAYVAMHGIPHHQLKKVSEFIAPYRAERNKRNRLMTDKINAYLNGTGISVDFDKDIVPLSMSAEGGSITERHLLYAVALKIIEAYGKGEKTVDFLKNTLKLHVSAKIESFLSDAENPHYAYDLLGVLKSDMVSHIYIEATAECPPIEAFAAFAKEVGAISAYPYLGDIKESVTGDKKAQKFEDEYLELVLETMRSLGFNAIAYMPSRNTKEQLIRLRELCDRYGFFQISGEDINSSRQSFICLAQRDPMFANLADAAWALIGHEKEATRNGTENGMFSEKTVAAHPSMDDRIAIYKTFGKEL